VGRKSKRQSVTDAARAYLALAEMCSPDEYPLDVGSVAAAVGCVRASLYNYGLQSEILAAAQRQRERHATVPDTSLKGLLRQLRVELVATEARNQALLERLNLVEANAARLGIALEDLYQPLLKPPRHVSQAGRRRHS